MKTDIFIFASISANILKWIMFIWMGISLYRYSENAFWTLFIIFVGTFIVADLTSCIKDLLRKNSDKKN